MKDRKVISVVIENEKGEIMLLHRRADLDFHPDLWFMIAGHIEEGETSDECIKRELKEELDIDDFEVLDGPIHFIDSLTGEDYNMHVDLYKIKLKNEYFKVDPVEHDDYKWVKPSVAMKHKSIAGLVLNLRKLGYEV